MRTLTLLEAGSRAAHAEHLLRCALAEHLLRHVEAGHLLTAGGSSAAHKAAHKTAHQHSRG